MRMKDPISIRLLFMFLFVVALGNEQMLKENFYSASCPNVEIIVRQVVAMKLSQTFITVPATLRLFFHDCFITGCDASVLISSQNSDAEKDAPDNISLAGDGFDTVIKAKQAVEIQCPGVISCADIIAIAARDVVSLAGGPNWMVELGRRDGMISRASLVAGKLPEPSFNLSQLNNLFARHNLSQTDIIALSGAHTVGFSHCTRLTDRLYSKQMDSSLNHSYAEQLMQACPQNVDPQVAVQMDPVTPRIFDNMYYKNLMEGKGMFISDQILFTDPGSRPTAVDFAENTDHFAAAFVEAMRKLGRTGVKTGKEGEIRKECESFNA